MTIEELLASLQASGLANRIRDSLYLFPLIESTHVIGLSMVFGTIAIVDLRLLGASLPRCRVSEVYRRLMPWTLSGFVVMFITGAILFVAYATKAYGNQYFRIKLSALLLAAINALIFHLVTERQIARWNEVRKVIQHQPGSAQTRCAPPP